jgi:serine/threonine-protein kinase RsbW
VNKEEKIELDIPNNTEYLDDIRNFVIKIAQKFEFEKDDIDDIEFAVDEACANIIEHAYDGEKGKIKIKVTCNEEKFSIELHDEGKEFDPTTKELPDLEKHHEQKKTGGLGIFIMKKLMDNIRHSYKNGAGNYLIMEKYKKKN